MKKNNIIAQSIYDGKFVKRIFLISKKNKDDGIGLNVSAEAAVNYPTNVENNGYINDNYDIIFNDINELKAFKHSLEKNVIPAEFFNHTFEYENNTYKYIKTENSIYATNISSSNHYRNKFYIISGHSEFKRIINDLLKWCDIAMNDFITDKNAEQQQHSRGENMNIKKDLKVDDEPYSYDYDKGTSDVLENLTDEVSIKENNLKLNDNDKNTTDTPNVTNNRVISFVHCQGYSLMISHEWLPVYNTPFDKKGMPLACYRPLNNKCNTIAINTIFINHNKYNIIMFKTTLESILAGCDIKVHISNNCDQNDFYLAGSNNLIEIDRNYIMQGNQVFKLSEDSILTIITQLNNILNFNQSSEN